MSVANLDKMFGYKSPFTLEMEELKELKKEYETTLKDIKSKHRKGVKPTIGNSRIQKNLQGGFIPVSLLKEGYTLQTPQSGFRPLTRHQLELIAESMKLKQSEKHWYD